MTRKSVEETAASVIKIHEIYQKNEIILASKSKVRKEILEKNNIKCKVVSSNIDEDPIKQSLLNEELLQRLSVKTLQKKPQKCSQTKMN